MWKHIKDVHNGNIDNVKFEFKVTGKFKKTIKRQIDEACRIEKTRGKGNLNSRKEYNGQSIKRVIIDNIRNSCTKCNFETDKKEDMGDIKKYSMVKIALISVIDVTKYSTVEKI